MLPRPPLTAGTSGCGGRRRPHRSWSRSSRVPRAPRCPGLAAGGAEQGLGARGPAPVSPGQGPAWRKVTVSARAGLERPGGPAAHPEPLTCAVPPAQPRLSQARSSSHHGCRHLREQRLLSPTVPRDRGGRQRRVPHPGIGAAEAGGPPPCPPRGPQRGGRKRDGGKTRHSGEGPHHRRHQPGMWGSGATRQHRSLGPRARPGGWAQPSRRRRVPHMCPTRRRARETTPPPHPRPCGGEPGWARCLPGQDQTCAAGPGLRVAP